MTIEEKISFLSQVKIILLDNNSWLDGTKEPIKESFDTAIKSLEAWEKIDDEIASLQHTYFIGGTETEKAIWENLQAVRKTIHEYLNEVSELTDNELKPNKNGVKTELEPCDDWYDVPSDEMTLEQARQAVKDLRKKLAEYLEQKPCDDCISREAVHSLMAMLLSDYLHDEDREKIELIDAEIAELPPVNPQPKTGHWINKTLICKSEAGSEYDCYTGTCSVCGETQECWNYCGGCGARMVSE